MATPIATDASVPKQVEPSPGQGTAAPATTPTSAAIAREAVQPEGIQSTYIKGAPTTSDAIARTLGDVQSPQNFPTVEPRGTQTTVTILGSDSDALQSLVDNFVTARTDSVAQSSLAQSASRGGNTILADAASSDTDLHKIVTNIGNTSPESFVPAHDEKSTSTQPRNASSASTPGDVRLTETASASVPSRTATNLLNTQNFIGNELEMMQTMIASLGTVMSDLQSLIDSYAIADQDPSAQVAVGRLLDPKVVSTLIRQASGTDLGKLAPGSNIYVLDTVPQTIVEDNVGMQQYSIFDISGDMIGHFKYAEAGAWGINMGDGRVVALGPNGYLGSLFLLGAQNRLILSGLGVPNVLGSVSNKKERRLQKISKAASPSDPFDDPDGCACPCFLMQQAWQGQEHRRDGRCVLCYHRPQ